jgi:type IX secretion system PorP/SprF family membrane protein
MKTLYTIIIILSSLLVVSQDIHFSNSSETPVLLNPALSSTAYDTRIVANYKSQWASVTTPYSTYGISLERAINHLKTKKTYVGVSLIAYSDKAGDLGLGSMMAQLGVNVVTKVARYAKLSGGIGGGVTMRSLNNPNNMKWESQYNGYAYDSGVSSGEAAPTSKFLQGDFVLGIDYHYSRTDRTISSQDGTSYDIGLSAFHFTVPKLNYTSNIDKQYTKIVFHTNFNIGIKNAGMAILPSLIYVRQGPAQQINGGVMFKRIFKGASVYTSKQKPAAFALGAFYRWNDAVIPSLLIEYDKYALGFSYDLNVSKLRTASKLNGGMEISFRFNVSPGYGKALGNNQGR